MAGVTVFQDHHVIERQAVDKSALLQNLVKQRLFNVDDPANRLNLPADPDVAAKIGIYPHSGGPLAEYSRGLGRHLLDLENSLDGQLALQGDKAAAVRIAEQVNTLRNTMRAGLVNDDLLTNKPSDMTKAEARTKINSFFRDLESYTENHAAQIDRFARGHVNVWEAVTVSETKIQSALDAIELSGKKAAKGPAESAKFGLGLAVAEARQTGRLVVSPAFAQKLDTIWDTNLLDDVLNGKAVVSSANMATLFKGLKVVGVAGLIYDIGTSTAEAANATSRGDGDGAANIMARLAGRIYLGIEGAALGAAIGGAVGAPGGPVALASSVVGALVGGIGGAFIGDAAIEALWKAADDVILLLQTGTPEAGVATPLLQPSGKYYRELIASGMPKEVADKLARQLNAEYKERRLKQPNASVELLIESVIQDVQANQAIESEDEAYVIVIRDDKYATTTVDSARGKVETINFVETGKPVSSKLHNLRGRLIGNVQFDPDGSRVEDSFDPDTGRIMTSITISADYSSSKDIYDLRGRPTREQRYDPFGDLTSDIGPEGLINVTEVSSEYESIRRAIESQSAVEAEGQKKASAKAEAERQATEKAEAERQSAAKAEAERQAAAKAEAERQMAAERAERDRRAIEEVRKYQEEQIRLHHERLRQEEQSRREQQERQRQWQQQQEREAEQRRQQVAAEQARRDAERERLNREAEQRVFENLRRQQTFSNLPSSSTIFKPPGRLEINVPYNPKVGITGNERWYYGGSRIRPVAFDLNGDARLEIMPLSGGVDRDTYTSEGLTYGSTAHFDADGNGILVSTAWIGPHDGILAIDLGVSEVAGPDGKISRPEEIAFSLWKSEEERVAELKAQGIDDTGRPVTDLEGLRFAFDTNQDNRLDSRDSRWGEFRIWQDFNQNGSTDTGELSTLEAEGIAYIDLLPSEKGAKAFPDGSAITGTSSAKRIDGTSILVGDVALAYRPAS